MTLEHAELSRKHSNDNWTMCSFRALRFLFFNCFSVCSCSVDVVVVAFGIFASLLVNFEKLRCNNVLHQLVVAIPVKLANLVRTAWRYCQHLNTLGCTRTFMLPPPPHYHHHQHHQQQDHYYYLSFYGRKISWRLNRVALMCVINNFRDINFVFRYSVLWILTELL